MGKKVLVTGGTGFIGQAVVRKLLSRGYEVTLLVRPNRSRPNPWEKETVRTIDGDITRPETLNEALAGMDAVFHLAAWYEMGVKETGKMRLINIEGTRNILQKCLELGIEKVVYCSSTAVYGDTLDVVADETFERRAPFLSVYEETKYEAHQIARELRDQGLPLVIVLPGAVYGPGDHSPMMDVLRRYVQRKLPVFLKIDRKLPFVYVDDVAEGIVLAFERGLIGEEYILSGEAVDPGLIFRELANMTGFRPPILVPPFLLQWLMPLLPLLTPFINGQKLINKEALSMILQANRAFRTDKAKKELRWSPRPFHQGIKETVESLKPGSLK